MVTELRLGEITIEVVRKDIRNVHLSVNPPFGKVRLSAPVRMSLDLVRAYALTKIGWIKAQQAKIRGQEREVPREYLDRESHYVWGVRYLLEIQDTTGAHGVELQHSRLVVRIRPGTSRDSIKGLVNDWYRGLVREASRPIIEKWTGRLGVAVESVHVQQMKTKWGACSPGRGAIRLNTELAKRAPEFLDYVILHEIAHLVEPNHGERFQMLLDRHLPNWRQIRDELNRLPIPYGEWN